VSSIHFEYWEFFWLIPLFILCSIICKPKSNSIIFPKVKFFGGVAISKFQYFKYVKWITILALISALASPYTKLVESVEPKRGLNIALVLDTSDSMRAMGFSRERLNRFQIVKKVVADFIEKREMDNLGLVVFGEYAFISSPLTYDKRMLHSMLHNLHIGIAGKSTAIYDAIGQTVSLLKSEENASNIAILITDGINTAGVLERQKAIDLAKRRNIKIYTIGIGRQGEINPLDLSDIAKQTGGKFFMARDGKELQSVYDEIDKLEKREIKNIEYELKEYLYFYPLLLALLGLTLYITLRNRRELV
jgi:Ca-activated chloride channel family protein